MKLILVENNILNEKNNNPFTTNTVMQRVDYQNAQDIFKSKIKTQFKDLITSQNKDLEINEIDKSNYFKLKHSYLCSIDSKNNLIFGTISFDFKLQNNKPCIVGCRIKFIKNKQEDEIKVKLNEVNLEDIDETKLQAYISKVITSYITPKLITEFNSIGLYSNNLKLLENKNINEGIFDKLIAKAVNKFNKYDPSKANASLSTTKEINNKVYNFINHFYDILNQKITGFINEKNKKVQNFVFNLRFVKDKSKTLKNLKAGELKSEYFTDLIEFSYTIKCLGCFGFDYNKDNLIYVSEWVDSEGNAITATKPEENTINKILNKLKGPLGIENVTPEEQKEKEKEKAATTSDSEIEKTVNKEKEEEQNKIISQTANQPKTTIESNLEGMSPEILSILTGKKATTKESFTRYRKLHEELEISVDIKTLDIAWKKANTGNLNDKAYLVKIFFNEAYKTTGPNMLKTIWQIPQASETMERLINIFDNSFDNYGSMKNNVTKALSYIWLNFAKANDYNKLHNIILNDTSYYIINECLWSERNWERNEELCNTLMDYSKLQNENLTQFLKYSYIESLPKSAEKAFSIFKEKITGEKTETHDQEIIRLSNTLTKASNDNKELDLNKLIELLNAKIKYNKLSKDKEDKVKELLKQDTLNKLFDIIK